MKEVKKLLYMVAIRGEEVSPFVKLEMISPLLCCLLDPLTDKYCRTRVLP